MPARPDVSLQRVAGDADEVSAIQAVFDDCPGYFERVTGRPAPAQEARTTLSELPAGAAAADKHDYAIRVDGRTVGCVDVVRGFPDARRAMLGLLLIGESSQGLGIGSAAYAHVEAIASTWRGCERVRIGVVRTNACVLGFWHAMGFEETGEIRPYRAGSIRSEVVVLEKRIGCPADI